MPLRFGVLSYSDVQYRRHDAAECGRALVIDVRRPSRRPPPPHVGKQMPQMLRVTRHLPCTRPRSPCPSSAYLGIGTSIAPRSGTSLAAPGIRYLARTYCGNPPPSTQKRNLNANTPSLQEIEATPSARLPTAADTSLLYHHQSKHKAHYLNLIVINSYWILQHNGNCVIFHEDLK